MGGGGGTSFTHTERGDGKRFCHAEGAGGGGGTTRSFVVVLTQEVEV